MHANALMRIMEQNEFACIERHFREAQQQLYAFHQNQQITALQWLDRKADARSLIAGISR